MAASENLLRIQAALIGALLRDSAGMGEAAAELRPELFEPDLFRPIWEAMCRLHFAGAPIDRQTVLHELGEDYAEAVEQALRLSTGDLGYYCRMLKEEGRLEALRAEAGALSLAQTLSEAVAGLDRLNELAADRRSARITPAAEAANAFCDRTAAQELPEYLPWGLPELDRLLTIQRGDLVILGGYPSAGKTLLALQFALAMAAKYRVGFFSLETSPAKLTDRLLAHMARVPLSKIKRRDLGEADWLALTRACEALSTLRLDLVDAGGCTARDIRAVTLNRRYEVVFVDYLQLVSARGKSRYEEVTAISLALHELARTGSVAVIALAQLSRPEQTRERKNGDVKPIPPTLSSFRESGQIEQDADAAMLLYPADPKDNRSGRVLRLAKNKDGDRAQLFLDFDGPLQTMTVPPPSKGETYRAVMAASAKARKERAAIEGQAGLHELPPDEGGPLPF